MSGAQGESEKGLVRQAGDQKRLWSHRVCPVPWEHVPGLLHLDSGCHTWGLEAAKVPATCALLLFHLNFIMSLQYMGHVPIATWEGGQGPWDLLRSHSQVIALLNVGHLFSAAQFHWEWKSLTSGNQLEFIQAEWYSWVDYSFLPLGFRKGITKELWIMVNQVIPASNSMTETLESKWINNKRMEISTCLCL